MRSPSSRGPDGRLHQVDGIAASFSTCATNHSLRERVVARDGRNADGGILGATRHPCRNVTNCGKVASARIFIVSSSSAHSPERQTIMPDTDIRAFRVDVPEAEIEELRRRIDATRWPTGELVADRSQGVQLAAIQELARFWTTEYDWRRCEAKLNALPQFKTTIDGVDIHFIHVRSAHDDALPLIMTHGWRGSIVELLETIGPLTDPTAHGGTAGDAFHLVLPSIPGYGFSDEPTELGWGPVRIGRAWDELMR